MPWWSSVGIKQVLTLLMIITYPVSIALSSVFSMRLLFQIIIFNNHDVSGMKPLSEFLSNSFPTSFNL